jgi:hypothetical protein
MKWELKKYKHLSQNSRCPNRDSNWAAHECTSETVPLEPPDSVFPAIEYLHKYPRKVSYFICTHHSRIVLSVGGSVWYLVRNLRCMFTIDSTLANSKIQNAFLSLVHAMFRRDCPLAVKRASTSWRLLPPKELGEILYLLICFFLRCLSWLLRCRVWNLLRDLWIILQFRSLSLHISTLNGA